MLSNLKEHCKISFKSIEDIQEFINLTISIPCDITLYKKHYEINGKSFLGIMSLSPLSTDPISVYIEDENYIDNFLSIFKKYLIT